MFKPSDQLDFSLYRELVTEYSFTPKNEEQSTNKPTKKFVYFNEYYDAVEHVVKLLEASGILLLSQHYYLSIFSSITAIEELSKIYVGFYSSGQKGSKNVFYDHRLKHKLAISPVLEMGNYYSKILDSNEFFSLIKQCHSKEGLMKIRNRCLYMERGCNSDQLFVPSLRLTQIDAAKLLTFAIAVFDEALILYPRYQDRIDRIFNKVKPIVLSDKTPLANSPLFTDD